MIKVDIKLYFNCLLNLLITLVTGPQLLSSCILPSWLKERQVPHPLFFSLETLS